MVTRLGLTQSSLDGYDVTFLRYGVAGVILLPFLLRKGLGGIGFMPIVIMTFGLGFPYMLIAAYGLAREKVEVFALLTPGTMIISAVLMSVVLLRAPMSRSRIAGMGIVLTGLVLIGVQEFSSGEHAVLPALFFIASGLLWAGYTICTRAYAVGPFHATAIVSVFSMLFYAPAYLLWRGVAPLSQAPFDAILLQAIYQGVFVSGVALYFYSRSIFLLGSALGASFAALIPGISIVLASLILGEFPSLLVIAGLGALTFGMSVTLLAKA